MSVVHDVLLGGPLTECGWCDDWPDDKVVAPVCGKPTTYIGLGEGADRTTDPSQIAACLGAVCEEHRPLVKEVTAIWRRRELVDGVPTDVPALSAPRKGNG